MPTTARSKPLFSTADYDVIVIDTTNPEVGPWRGRSFVVVHRQYDVIGAVSGVLTEACIAAKVMQETLDVVMANLHKPIAELSEIEPVRRGKGMTFN